MWKLVETNDQKRYLMLKIKPIIGGSLIKKSKNIILYAPTAAARRRLLENKNQDVI